MEKTYKKIFNKPFKTFENGKVEFFGNNHWKELFYEIPEWNEDDKEPEIESCFKYHGQTYFLSEFMRTESYKGFVDGIRGDSFFSGIGVKISNCGDSVKVFTILS